MIKKIIIFYVFIFSAGFAFGDVSYSAMLGMYHDASNDYESHLITSAIKKYREAVNLSTQYIRENPDNPKGYVITLDSYNDLRKIYTTQGLLNKVIEYYEQGKEVVIKLYSLSELDGEENPYFEEYKMYFKEFSDSFDYLKSPVKYNIDALYFILKIDPDNREALESLNTIKRK